MSAIAALIGTRGSTVTIERPTSWTRNANGSQVPSGYTEVATGVKVLIAEVTEELAIQVFGQNATVNARGFVAGTPNIQKNDRLVVTAGHRNGGTFVVEVIRDEDYGSTNRHYDLGLNSTAETIA